MNRTTITKNAKRLALGLAALALAAAPSFAAELAAVPGQWTPPGGGAPMDMWGYIVVPDAASYTCPVSPVTWTVGPTLTATAGAVLTVNLKNCLTEPVSFFVPGLRSTTIGGSAGKFTAEAAIGGTVTYTFNLTGRSGTFLYQSATDRIRTQVPMGLYGALVVDTLAGVAYPGVPYTQDEVLVYSEIDPSLTATSGGARVSKVDDRVADGFDATESGWVPRYFLINGKAYPSTAHLSFTAGDVLLRFVNAGLDSVMPTLEGGLYLDLIAEDGNVYPHPMLQYGLELQAGKTIDAMVRVSAPGTYALYDRSGHLTNAAATGGGMLTYLDVIEGAGLFELGAATYSVAENVAGGILTVTVNRVGGSAGAVSVQYATADGTATAAGLDYTAIPLTTLNFDDLQTSATFNVAILDDVTYEGDETFNVNLSAPTGGATLGTPASAVVTIVEDDAPPNQPPLANDDLAAAPKNSPGITFSVTANDVDPDGTINVATVVITTGPNTQFGGTVVENNDGTVTYVPRRGFRGTDTFQYTVNDNDGATSNVATVRVNVN